MFQHYIERSINYSIYRLYFKLCLLATALSEQRERRCLTEILPQKAPEIYERIGIDKLLLGTDAADGDPLAGGLSYGNQFKFFALSMENRLRGNLV